MALIVIAVSVLIIVFMVRCIRKEKSLAGFYEAINVCSRWYAFFTANFLLSGATFAIATPVVLVLAFMGKLDALSEQPGDAAVMVVFLALIAVAFLLIGKRMYTRVLEKCPEELKSRLLKDMVVILVGTCYRIGFIAFAFIFQTWWTLTKPTEYLVNGRTVYAFPGSNDLYAGGSRVGVANSDKTEAVMTDPSYRS